MYWVFIVSVYSVTLCLYSVTLCLYSVTLCLYIGYLLSVYIV